MKLASCSAIVLALLLMGCGGGDETDSEGESTSGTSTGGAATSEGGAGGDSSVTGDPIALTPDNTKIVFIGSHAPPREPEPRTCEFTDFAGTATVSEGELTAVSVTIKTEGITSFDQRLTDHLRNPDFFNALEYPEAKFESTSIETGDDGTVTITGDLTLLAETKPVTFPATVSTEDGLSLNAEFQIDRTEWGMTSNQEGVLKEVTLQIEIDG